MRTYQLLAALSLPLLAVAAAGCGPDFPTYTVQGQKLIQMEANYSTWTGAAPSYCGTLDNRGQFEVVLSDSAICGQVHAKANNRTVFHSSAETNMRLVFPTFLMKNADGSFKTNKFTVGTTDCKTTNPSGATAVAYFSHNATGSSTYDLNVQADSGSVSVTAYDGQSSLKGTFDLMFAGEHVTGAFDTVFCMGLDPSYGQ